MEFFNIITLALSSLLLVFVGTMRLSNPIKTYAKNSGIELNQDVDLLNEIRGLSAVMLTGGLLVLMGIFFPEFRTASFLIGALIFIGFLIGRIVSFGVDGKPNKLIIQGTLFEIMFGAMNLICLLLALS